MSIYADLILDHYEHPRNNKTLEKPSRTVDVSNPLCGDRLHVEIKVSDGVITDIGFQGEGCAISMASASILSEYAKGKQVKELVDFSPQDMIGLLGIELTPNRLKCGLLSWEALKKIINNS